MSSLVFVMLLGCFVTLWGCFGECFWDALGMLLGCFGFWGMFLDGIPGAFGMRLGSFWDALRCFQNVVDFCDSFRLILKCFRPFRFFWLLGCFQVDFGMLLAFWIFLG